jgi:hypothetical protein
MIIPWIRKKLTLMMEITKTIPATRSDLAPDVNLLKIRSAFSIALPIMITG